MTVFTLQLPCVMPVVPFKSFLLIKPAYGVFFLQLYVLSLMQKMQKCKVRLSLFHQMNYGLLMLLLHVSSITRGGRLQNFKQIRLDCILLIPNCELHCCSITKVEVNYTMATNNYAVMTNTFQSNVRQQFNKLCTTINQGRRAKKYEFDFELTFLRAKNNSAMPSNQLLSLSLWTIVRLLFKSVLYVTIFFSIRTFITQGNWTRSRLCPSGHYCPAGTGQPLPCPAGSLSTSQGRKGDEDCPPCPPGAYCDRPALAELSDALPCHAG